MNKLLLLAVLLVSSSFLYAQRDVTQFLGIPVEGSKSEMVRQLKAKGYSSSPYDKEVLVGKFNGTGVTIRVVTNNDKVYRIVVADSDMISEGDIKIRFNTLCQQFQNNNKYLSETLSTNYVLSDDEDISYGMIVKSKRYQAAYYQLPETIDSVAVVQEISSFFLSEYTKEQLAEMSEDDLMEAVVSYIQEKYSKKSVWFMIAENAGKYYIVMYYDNEYNKANGEDL